VTGSHPAAKDRMLAGALELCEQRARPGSDDLDAGASKATVTASPSAASAMRAAGATKRS
jgi:hypothetical protein